MTTKPPKLTKADAQSQQELINKLYFDKLKENPLLFGFTYCQNHFRDASAPFHYKIFKEMMEHKFLAVAAPRGSAKSTILAFLRPVHAISFKLKHYIPIVGSSQEKANEKLDTIKKFFKDENRFGIRLTKDTESIIQLRHPDGFETKVSTFGRDQVPKIRGAKFGAHRPDLILIDDLQDDKQVENPMLRQEVRQHFEDAVLKSLDPSTGECVVIGTILHDDCLIARLVSQDHYTTWRKLLYKSLYRSKKTDKLCTIWPDKEGWTVSELVEDRKRNPRTFAKEKQNNPVSGVMARFKKEQFRYWRRDGQDVTLLAPDSRIVSRYSFLDCKAAIACDLAWSEKKTADDSVILPAFLTPKNEILVDRYTAAKGMRPAALTEIIFTMEARLRSLTGSVVPIGFEKAMLERVYQSILKAEMKKRNHYLITKELAWESDKITRIETVLEPRYSQNVIYHLTDMGDLEYQLLKFPSASHDDIVDALQGVVKLLQFPKKKGRTTPALNPFMRLRQFHIDSKFRKRPTGRFNFGNKRSSLPAQVSPL